VPYIIDSQSAPRLQVRCPTTRADEVLTLRPQLQLDTFGGLHRTWDGRLRVNYESGVLPIELQSAAAANQKRCLDVGVRIRYPGCLFRIRFEYFLGRASNTGRINAYLWRIVRGFPMLTSPSKSGYLVLLSSKGFGLPANNSLFKKTRTESPV
jgi:hypothetical protein